MISHVVIVGSSAAGISCATRLRALSYEGDITIVTSSPYLPYNTCLLADYLAGERPREGLFIRSEQFFEEQRIKYISTMVINQLINSTKTIKLSSGDRLSYDKLLIASGTQAHKPSSLKYSGQGVFSFHTLGDVEQIKTYVSSSPPRHAIVVGGGLSGIECADALSHQGIKVTLVEREKSLLKGLTTSGGSNFIAEKAVGCQVEVLLQTEITSLVFCADKKLQAAILSNGQTLDCSLIVFAIGAHRDLSFLETSSIQHTFQGICTNQFLATSDEDVYAAGDVALVYDRGKKKVVPSCTWPDAIAQGNHAASSIMERFRPYQGTCQSIGSTFFGQTFVSGGDLEGEEVFESVLSTGYYSFVLCKGILKGFSLVGKVQQVGVLRRALEEEEPFDPSSFIDSLK